MKPNRITVSRSKRGTVVKATGHAAQVLFDRLAAEFDARQPRQAVGPCTVHFEDHGQDFLEWDLAPGGLVLACRPLQGFVWVGCVVLAAPQPGQQLRYSSPLDGQAHVIRYPVAKVVQQLLGAPAAPAQQPVSP